MTTPPPNPYPSYPAPIPPKKGKGKKIAGFGCLGLIIVVLIVVIASCASILGGGSDSASGGSAAGSGKDAQKSAQVGDAVTSGNLQVTVTKVGKDKTKVGNEYIGKKAQGRFVQVNMTIKNVGDSAEYFSDTDVKLKDAKGTEYSADSEAAAYISDSNALFEQINPGNTNKGIVVFDVSKKAIPTTLEFQGGLFDSPIAVDLTK